MSPQYKDIKITIEEANTILLQCYGMQGKLSEMPGEIDFNFCVKTDGTTYMLKVSRPDADLDELDFSEKILNYVGLHHSGLTPKFYVSKDNLPTTWQDTKGRIRYVRMLHWIDGRLYSSVNPINDDVLYSLGQESGKVMQALQGFDHVYAHRYLVWDVDKIDWTKEYLHLFDEKQKAIINHFYRALDVNKSIYENLRCSVIHNDVNDNNIVVSEHSSEPKVKAIIDYGDAVYTKCINDLAITIAYAAMGKCNPIEAAVIILGAYHSKFPLQDEELKCLYALIAARLMISVTKSAINKEIEKDNEYLLISEKPAWVLLRQWKSFDAEFAYYQFRAACGMNAHPHEDQFSKWAGTQELSLNAMFPNAKKEAITLLDLSIGSTWLGHKNEYEDDDIFSFKIDQLQKENPHTIIAGGYMEPRPIYTTDAYKREGNNGNEWRTYHLGIDFWLPALSPVNAMIDGEIYSVHNNDNHKDYGPTLILKHEVESLVFYTLYGHLSKHSLDLWKVGDKVKAGNLLCYLGDANENGHWSPHLHFQIMLSMLDNTVDFQGVCFGNEKQIWQSICPDPNLLFKQEKLNAKYENKVEDILTYRKNHLGKSLSISYIKPLHMLRGEGAYLIDHTGRKYIDTVNNVAHVGHEHHRVVKAGQQQMSTLNTNTRYLHENINALAKKLLTTFPEELSVVHFVNSGSEANELALRMAKVFTSQKDIIAMEIGYHGNTQGCIDVSSYKFDRKGGNGAPPTTHIVPLPDKFRGIYRGESTGLHYAEHVNTIIHNLNNDHKKPAAFLCESIISCGGQIDLPQNFLKAAYESVKAQGGVTISDEVQAGLGRVGSHYWGFQLHDVVPDIVTIGKPLGNGHPLAAVVCTQAVANAFANGMEYFNTFGGNPVSCAIGLEVLNIIEDEGLQEHAQSMGAYIKSTFREMQKDFPIIGDIRGEGLFLGIEFTDHNLNPLTAQASYLANRMRDFGILMSTDGKDDNAIKIKPPMVISKNQIEEVLDRIRFVLKEDFFKM